METLKAFNRNCAKSIIVITFISTILSSNLFAGIGPPGTVGPPSNGPGKACTQTATDAWQKSGSDIRLCEEIYDNVGIGVTTPTARLTISSPSVSSPNFEMPLRTEVADASGDFFQIVNSTGNTGQYIPLLWGHHETDNRQALALLATITSAKDDSARPIMTFDSRIADGNVFSEPFIRPLFAWTSVGNPKMTMLANGNLGIATINPQEKFHVNGNIIAQSTIALVGPGFGSEGGQIILADPTQTQFSEFNAWSIDNNNGKLRIFYNDGLGPVALNIDNITGNVGVDINPQEKFHVNGNIIAQSTIALVGPGFGSEGGQIILADPTQTQFSEFNAWSIDNNNGKLRIFYDDGSGPLGLEIDNITGNVGIGKTPDPTIKLDIAGTLRACTLRVNLTGGGCDYVLEEGYKKDELDYVRYFTKKHHHLPGVKSAKEMIKEGLNVSNMFTTLLKKIEEIFLHLFDLDKAINGLSNIVDDLMNNDKAMEKRVKELEKQNKELKIKNMKLEDGYADLLMRVEGLEKNKKRNKKKAN
ncbi:MAG: hypothetical protein FVQ77_13260 [Cytophagales bacterium]|nr:hypothetical protein [Cytophagales bacterium]